MDFNQDIFSRRIQTAIARKGLSVPRFADMIGVSKTTVYNWIHAKNVPHRSKLPEIAGILEVSPGWLMGFEDEDSCTVLREAPDTKQSEFIHPFTVHAISDSGISQSSNAVAAPSYEQESPAASRPSSFAESARSVKKGSADSSRQAQDMIRHIVDELLQLQLLFANSSV